MVVRRNQNRYNVEVGLLVDTAHQLGTLDAQHAADALGFPVTKAAIAKANARLAKRAA